MEGGQTPDQQQSIFSLGKKQDLPKENEKKADTGEDRMAQTLGIKDDKKDAKRERDNYAVNLRKQKREELQKRRRGLGNSQNTQEANTDLSSAAAGAGGQMSLDGQNFQNFTIEEALNYQRTNNINLETFITNIANKIKFEVGDFSNLQKMIQNEDLTIKLMACVGLRRLLSIENTPPIQAVIDANLVQVFIELLHHNIPKFQFEAAWCLTNIASGTTDHVNNLIEKNVLQHFIQLLESPHIEVVEQVIWGIGNIAGDSPMTRDSVLHSGALDKIAAVLERATPGTSFMRNASWALSNLCRGRPQPDYSLVRRAIPTLVKVLVENDKEDIITDICWALSYLSDGAKERVNDLLSEPLLTKIIQLLNHEQVAIAIPCLRTIGNIVTGDDNQTQMAVDAGLIRALNQILGHQKKTVRKESCWVLSNITAGTKGQLQECIDLGVVDKLVQILQHDDMAVKNEAVWALSNCTASANPQQFEVLVQKGLIKALGEVLKINDVRMLAVALEGLENTLNCGQKNYINNDGENVFSIILEQQGCLDDLENLQTHANHNIYTQALKIIDKYFSQDQEMDPLINAIDNATQQNFSQTPAGKGLFDL